MLGLVLVLLCVVHGQVDFYFNMKQCIANNKDFSNVQALCHCMKNKDISKCVYIPTCFKALHNLPLQLCNVIERDGGMKYEDCKHNLDELCMVHDFNQSPDFCTMFKGFKGFCFGDEAVVDGTKKKSTVFHPPRKANKKIHKQKLLKKKKKKFLKYGRHK
jgi:hypothetical protein